MFGTGIPPSPDRQDRIIFLVLGSLVSLLVFFALMYFVIRSPHRPSGFRTDTAPSGEERLEAYLAEKERASAYEALRDELDKKQEEPGIAAVFCRDCRHRWIGKRIEFEGDVEFQDLSGRLLSHTYTALLSGDSVHGWTVDTLAVKPGRIFPPKH